MSTLTQLLRPIARPAVVEMPVVKVESPAPAETAAERALNFAAEQVSAMVQQVFSPASGKAPRHVVVSGVDESTYIAGICMDMAKLLAAQLRGNVCALEANDGDPQLETVYGNQGARAAAGEELGFLRSSSQRLGGGLWLAPPELLFGTTRDGKSPAWLERRLSDFRLEFDYTILHAPPAGRSGDAGLLGRFSDGVVLVVEANATRRVTAQNAKQKLLAANARLLGVVLSERTFPIPEEIYKRL
jgi:hypothetical protein